jgi:CRP/FNR family cyclic AMP-dependent transcriptional regulator
MPLRTNLAKMFTNAAELEDFSAGTTIFRQGDAGSSMYVVKKGELSVAVDGKQVTTLRDDDIFGEMSLIDHAPRSATVTAISDCTLIPLNEKRFLFLVSEAPFFSLDVMKVIADRLRVMNRLL